MLLKEKKRGIIMLTVKTILNNYENVSLKRICDETKLCYQYVLKASKLPEPNKVYDVDNFNDEAVMKILNKRNVNLDDYNWDEINETSKKPLPVNLIEDFNLNTTFKLRNDEKVYKVIYKTITHIVFIDSLETQPRVMNNETFIHQSPRILG